MSMPILAFFSRSLRVESRSIWLYMKRLALLVVVLLYLVTMHLTMAFFGAPGLRFFAGVMHVNVFFICILAVSYFSSAISEEKEEQTLGLLRMTKLNPISILLGKSTSRTIGAILLILAQLPFTLLAVTLGGVSLTQVSAAYATLLAYVVFVSGLGLFCSLMCRRTANAAGLTGIVLLGFFLIPPLGLFLLSELVASGRVSAAGWFHTVCEAVFGWMLRVSPFSRIAEIMETNFSGHPVGFQVMNNVGMGIFFFVSAWLLFNRLTREEKTPSPARGLLFRRRKRGGILSPGRAWSGGLIWKEFYFSAGGVLGLFVRFFLLGGFIVFVVYLRRPFGRYRVDWEDIGGVMMICTLIVAYLEMVLQASRVLQSEVRWRTLSSIMILPMGVWQLAYRKFLGCLIPMPLYLAFLIGGVVLNPDGFAEGFGECFSSVWGWHTLAQAVFFLNLVLCMSVLVRRAGFVLAFVIWLGGNMVVSWVASILMMMFFLVGGPAIEITYIVMTVLIFMGAVLLHCAALKRLKTVAGR